MTLPGVVVGLGNPGEYDDTPHNIGFAVVETLARRQGAAWQQEPRFQSRSTEVRLGLAEGPGQRVRLLEPLTYMNLSGQAVRAFLAFYKLPVSSLLVVCDDFQIPFGQLRFRTSGSSGGHNGLASVQAELGTSEYARLRCGVGPCPEHLPAADFVLRPFPKAIKASVEAFVERAADAVQEACTDGLAAAMSFFNQKTESNNLP